MRGKLHIISVPKLLIKATAARNDVTLIYHKVRGLYFLADIFAATIYI